MGGECFLGAKNLPNKEVALTLAQVGVGAGVGFKVDASRGHFFDHVPGEVGFVAVVYEFGDEEHGGGETEFLQNGKGVAVVVHIAIVEGEEDGAGRQWLMIGDGAGESVEVNGCVAVLGKIGHLGAEVVGDDGEVGAVDVGIFGGDADVVVHEDRDAHSLAKAIHRCGEGERCGGWRGGDRCEGGNVGQECGGIGWGVGGRRCERGCGCVGGGMRGCWGGGVGGGRGEGGCGNGRLRHSY